MSDKVETGGPATPAEAITPAAPAPAAVPAADAITARLAELGITDADTVGKIKGLGAETVEDLNGLQESDLVGVGVPILKARKVVAGLKPAPPPTAPATNGAFGAVASFDSILPSCPDDASWLNSLRSGGVLKLGQDTVISAIRAALADRFGLYSIAKRLLEEMEAYIDVTEEQVTEEFWAIRDQLTKKSYGDLFAAIKGLNASYVTDGRKKELLKRIDEAMWPAVIGFNDSLVAWQEAWMQGGMNPALMMGAIASLAGGGGGVMPPGMMQPPDCGVLRDAAETVNDAINKTFRGTGVQITAALAYEANEIKKMLENPRLPMLCGMPSRDLLLKKLKVDVPPTYPRMEQNLTRFVLGILQVDRVAAGNEELQYFGSLFMLGSQIPWNDLEGVRPTFGRGRRPAGIGASDPFNGYEKKTTTRRTTARGESDE